MAALCEDLGYLASHHSESDYCDSHSFALLLAFWRAVSIRSLWSLRCLPSFHLRFSSLVLGITSGTMVGRPWSSSATYVRYEEFVWVTFPERRSSASTLTDRKSTRLNSSHLGISYAVFCLKKK